MSDGGEFPQSESPGDDRHDAESTEKTPQSSAPTTRVDPGVTPPATDSLEVPWKRPVLPGYELLEELGRGGMGVVYRARQKALRRTVAVKVILAGPWASAEDRERLRREAEAAAHLRHPHIVAIHEVGEHEGVPFFSMDLIEGRTLLAIGRENPVAPRRAATYLRKIALAAHAAHESGILHRDLKPSNILIDADDEPHVTDFGIAKRLDPPEAGEDSEVPPELTRSGQAVGTPNYMPPEQAVRGRGELGPWSDVYALGAMLYHLVAGRPPFHAATPVETFQLLLEREPVPPRLLNPGVDRDLETVCLKCLRKEPSRRYGSARELADDLERYLSGEPVRARPVGLRERTLKWARRQPVVASLSVLSTVAVVALIVGAWISNAALRRGASVLSAISLQLVRRSTAC